MSENVVMGYREGLERGTGKIGCGYEVLGGVLKRQHGIVKVVIDHTINTEGCREGHDVNRGQMEGCREGNTVMGM